MSIVTARGGSPASVLVADTACKKSDGTRGTHRKLFAHDGIAVGFVGCGWITTSTVHELARRMRGFRRRTLKEIAAAFIALDREHHLQRCGEADCQGNDVFFARQGANGLDLVLLEQPDGIVTGLQTDGTAAGLYVIGQSELIETFRSGSAQATVSRMVSVHEAGECDACEPARNKEIMGWADALPERHGWTDVAERARREFSISVPSDPWSNVSVVDEAVAWVEMTADWEFINCLCGKCESVARPLDIVILTAGSSEFLSAADRTFGDE